MKHYMGSRTPMTVQDWLDLGWPQEKAEQFAAGTNTATRVVVVDDEGVRPLEHVVRHSPTGFEWGYAGSGPADLALAILCDHLDLRGEGTWADRLVRGDGRRLYQEPPYQRFKATYVANLPVNGAWRIGGDVVERFLVAEGYDLDDVTYTEEDED